MNWWVRLAVVWILIALGAAGFVAERFYHGSPVKTDILALLPQTERNPLAERAVQSLGEQLGNRAVFLIGHADGERAKQLARSFAGALRASGAFSQVTDAMPKLDADAVVDVYRPYRAALLAQSDRTALSSASPDLDTLLLRHLHQPMPNGIPTNPAEDPFGFLQRWLASLPFPNSRVAISDGLMTVQDNHIFYVLVLAAPKGAAFDTTVQERAVAAVNAAERSLKKVAADAVLLRTGAVFYAQAARANAESEVDLIGGGSLAGILLMMWWLFRSFRPLALAMLTVAIGVTCGMAAVLGAFGEVHLITIVFGASLIGEAVDYSIQYFAAHLADGAQWQARRGLKRVLPGLAIALATSLICYGTLVLTPFPAVSQIALFAFAGLAASWLSVVLLMPFFVTRPAGRNVDECVRLPRRFLDWWRTTITPRMVWTASVVLVLVSMPGWMQLAPNDDVRQLVTRPEHLVRQEAAIRSLVAGDASGRFFLVEGATEAEALAREEALVKRLRAQIDSRIDSRIAGYAAVSDFVPSPAIQSNNLDLLVRAMPPQQIAALLARHDFREGVATAWSSTLGKAQVLTLETWRNNPIATPFRHLILDTGTGGTALLVTLRGDDGSSALQDVAAGLAGVTFVDKTASVSALFAQYRVLAAWWIPIGMAIMLAVLAWRYGVRRGFTMLLPTVLATIIVLGVYGYAGVPLTMFSMMGFILVLGVGVNYAIFLIEAGDRAPAPFAGVLLSAATTILSFGLLALSSMPALHQFGLVLLLGVSSSVLLAPIALTLGREAT